MSLSRYYPFNQKINLVLLFGFCFILFLLKAIPIYGHDDHFVVTLETAPPVAEISPDDTLVHTTLKIADEHGAVLSDMYVKVHVASPEAGMVSPYLIADNTPLLEFDGILRDGVLEFDYVYPLSGEYDFHIQAGQSAEAISYQNTLHLNISQDFGASIYLIIFIGLLFGLGVGLFMGAKIISKQGVLVFLLLLGGSVTARTSMAQWGDGEDIPKIAYQIMPTINVDDLNLDYTMDFGVYNIPTLSTFTFSTTDANGLLIPESTFEIMFQQSGDEKPIFKTSLYAPTGESQLVYHFLEETEYQIHLDAHNEGANVQLQETVMGKGVTKQIRTTPQFGTTQVIFFSLAIIIGLLFGGGVQYMRRNRPNLASD